jgi:outer membrane cobalamin receptor
MKNLLALSLCAFAHVYALEITSRVMDPSGQPVSGAAVSITTKLGVMARSSTARDGFYRIHAEAPNEAIVIITAPGFARHESPVMAVPAETKLELAALSDAITVSGAMIEAPLLEQGSSTTVIDRSQIERSNEAAASDLLRTVPGLTIQQSGFRGGVTSLFLRGGDSKFNLVTIDGVPVNDMRFGGGFDFSNVPTDFLDRVEVTRGAQSAIYGSYANAGVVNFVTRLDDGGPRLNALAEGGTYGTRRFAVNGGGSYKGFRTALFGSQINTDGMVANEDYRNQNAGLNLGRRMGQHDVSFRSSFNASERGVPGPYGSNPVGNFSGIDKVSREWNNFNDYALRYDGLLTPRVRQQLFGTYFRANNTYNSQFGVSYNKDERGTAETRTTVDVNSRYTTAFGLAWSREQVRNSFITDASFAPFGLNRTQEGLYWENRLRFGTRLFINAGMRAEFFQTPAIPASGSRPAFTPFQNTKVNPKLSVAYQLAAATRLHGSFGLGIRPPGGFDLAFTNNPELKPERTASFDLGLDQQFGRKASAGVTYFYNRYYDLIVSLGGNLASLGRFRTDNLSNARARGLEFTGQYRPDAHWLIDANYTHLKTAVLSLDGSVSLAPQYFKVGQQLARRPAHSGLVRASYTRSRVSANFALQARGNTLDVEPNFGAFSGFFTNSGYANLSATVNYTVSHGVTAYVNLHNMLNDHYEEIYGYPSPRFNFVAGLKWNWSRD